jgi:glycosyltransferase involved in cell wall biosynthesis
MRFIYADPGLKDQVGHHANAARFITDALCAKGIDPEVLAFKDIAPDLAQSLGAKPYFRAHTYWITDGDPVCGWLSNFHRCADLTTEDLLKLDLSADDLVYMNSAQPPQFMGIVQYLRRAPDDRLPHIVMEFGTDPGAQINDSTAGYSLGIPDPRTDARSILHRFTSQCIPQRAADHLHLATFDPFSSEVYGVLIKRPVGVLPLLQHALSPPRLRAGQPAITIAVLGDQRGNKGYELVPQIARLLFKSHPTVRFLVHNSFPSRLPEAHEEVRKLAREDPRLKLDERMVDLQQWQELLDETDVMLCPYLPKAFRASYSALASEAVANAIPIVVPGKTTLATLAKSFDTGRAFENQDPQSIADAVLKVVIDFENQTKRALAAAGKWPQKHGPERTVEAILAVAR